MAEDANAEARQEQDEAQPQETGEVVGALVTETWEIRALSEPSGEHGSESILRTG